MLTPSTGFCGTPFNIEGDADGFKDRRIDINHTAELGADAAFVLDARGPGDHEIVARAAEVRRYLLGPLEGRVHGMSPANRIVVERHRATEVVHMCHQLIEV